MTTTPNAKHSGGVSFAGLLFLVFLTLKLCGVIGWSWWWVTAPLWGPIVLVLLIVGCIAVFAFIAGMIGGKP